MMPGNKRSPHKRPLAIRLGQEGQFWKPGQSRPGRIAVHGTVSGPSPGVWEAGTGDRMTEGLD